MPRLCCLVLCLAAISSSNAFSPLMSTPNPRVEALRMMPKNGKPIVSPSVAKANLWKLGEEIDSVIDAGAPWLHLSVQDGVFLPKLSFGSPIVKAIRQNVPDDIVLDVKLSTATPENRIAEFAKSGADIISFHPEAAVQPMAVINQIEQAGCAPGIVINPGLPISSIEPMLDFVDVVVVMLVNPGHGGPKYLDTALEKILKIRSICAARERRPWIEVDGGVSPKNAKELVAAGANALVAGGSVFSAADKRLAMQELIATEPLPAPGGVSHHAHKAL